MKKFGYFLLKVKDIFCLLKVSAVINSLLSKVNKHYNCFWGLFNRLVILDFLIKYNKSKFKFSPNERVIQKP